uniref:Uncharacterized protein n=1 Tax=Proboscia inermis TaxID=420281 RepID=A0A7S0GIJ2_9STRA
MPNIFLPIGYVLKGMWMSESLLLHHLSRATGTLTSSAADNCELFRDSTPKLYECLLRQNGDLYNPIHVEGCIDNSLFPMLFSYPPLTVLAIAFGIATHAPFSILYHLNAAKLSPGLEQLEHWSRRLDHIFIHWGWAWISFGVTGNLKYFSMGAVFNAYCILQQFKHIVVPKRNQILMVLAMAINVMPMISRGDLQPFILIVSLMVFSSWLFASYPLGPWSHAAFHLSMLPIPFIFFSCACMLPSSADHIIRAAQCAAASAPSLESEEYLNLL